MARRGAITVSCGEGNLGFLAGLGGAGSPHRAVATLEFVHTACRINKFLLAREKGMACGTNADFDVVLRRAGAIRGATRAADDGIDVIGMNGLLHVGGNIPNY